MILEAGGIVSNFSGGAPRVFRGDGGLELVAKTFGGPDSPPVVLIPATGQTKESWFIAAAALAEAGRYAICLDPRGHGASDRSHDGRYGLDDYAADLICVLAQLTSRAVLVAVGASGLAAVLAVASAAPGLVSALALVGMTPWATDEDAARIRAGLNRRAAIFTSKDEVVAAVVAAHPFEPAPTRIEFLLAAFEEGRDGKYRWRCDPRILNSIDLAASKDAIEHALSQLAVPVALIRGTDNESVPATVMSRLQAMTPGSEVIEIEGSGHYVPTEREDDFNAALLDFLERQAARHPRELHQGSEPRLLRDALGCFATGVTVVTTIGKDGEPLGLTANSFTSVSLDPPLVLFCLAKTSGNLEQFRGARGFAINVLNIGQQPVSNRFARRDSPRFDGTEWLLLQDLGSPVINGSLASFDCKTRTVSDGGDHLIFMGEVEHARYEPHRDPLLYFGGKYRRLHIG